jgi:hypothetical protein
MTLHFLAVYTLQKSYPVFFQLPLNNVALKAGMSTGYRTLDKCSLTVEKLLLSFIF